MNGNNNILIEANKEYGFNFPFMLVIPENIKDRPDLVVACTLPHDYARESKSFDEIIMKTREDFSSIDPIHEHLAFHCGNILFIPFIPKIRNLRPNFLGKKIYHNDFSDYEYIVEGHTDIIKKEDIEKYKNLPEQFNRMIKYAISHLKNMNINVDDRVIISGYSEGAKFASHFALLHPETIKTVIAGGTGGCISMPIKELKGYNFNFPTGIADLDYFDMDSFKNIKFFYYMGDEDKSDAARPYFETEYYIDENGNKTPLKDEVGNLIPSVDEDGNIKYILDENGNYTAKYKSCFSDEEVNAINKALGTVTQERFEKQREIYESLGLDSEFKMYQGNHKTIFNNIDQICSDVDSYIFDNNLSKS